MRSREDRPRDERERKAGMGSQKSPDTKAQSGGQGQEGAEARLWGPGGLGQLGRSLRWAGGSLRAV